MPVLVGITVVGAVLLIAGALLGFAAEVLGMAGPFGLPHPVLVAEILIVGALLCGAVVVALGAPGRAKPIPPRVIAFFSGVREARPARWPGGHGKPGHFL